MLSNDGQTLILVRVTSPGSRTEALQIYRRSGPIGRLVRRVPLTDLWTAAQIDPTGTGIIRFTDATPQWFAGGFLNFAADGKYLLYRTQRNDHLRIDLRDGSVRGVAPPNSPRRHAPTGDPRRP